MADDVWTAAAGAVGTIIGGTISWWVNRRTNQLRLAFDMHKEFNAKEMAETRVEAQNFLIANADNDSLSHLYDIDPQKTNCVWLVITFYQRLWLALHHAQLRKSLVPALFGEKFIWWYSNCFERQLFPDPAYGQYSEDIKKLREWIGRHALPDTLAEWRRRAELIGNAARRAQRTGLTVNTATRGE